MAQAKRKPKTHEGRLVDHAAQLLAEAGRDWRSVTWTEHTSKGSIQKRGGHIRAPRPTSRRRLMTLAHEIGHAQLHWEPDPNGQGWNISARAAALPLHQLEYEAELFVRLWFDRQGIALHDREVDIGRRYVAACVVTDLVAGVPIQRDVVEWCDLDPVHYLRIWATQVDVISLNVPPALLKFVGIEGDVLTAPEFQPGGVLFDVAEALKPHRRYHAAVRLLEARLCKPKPRPELVLKPWERAVVRVMNWLRSRLPRWAARWDAVPLR